MLTMAPANGTETIRKALAMGAAARRSSSPTTRSRAPTCRRRSGCSPRRRRRSRSTSCSAASTPPTARAGAVAAGVAARLGLPLLSAAAAIEPDPAAGRVRVRRLSARGYDLVEAPMPAVISCTQALGAPRYPSLKGIMAARSREIASRSLADLGEDLAPGRRRLGHAGRHGRSTAGARGRTRRVRRPRRDAAREIADFLADRRLI